MGQSLGTVVSPPDQTGPAATRWLSLLCALMAPGQSGEGASSGVTLLQSFIYLVVAVVVFVVVADLGRSWIDCGVVVIAVAGLFDRIASCDAARRARSNCGVAVAVFVVVKVVRPVATHRDVIRRSAEARAARQCLTLITARRENLVAVTIRLVPRAGGARHNSFARAIVPCRAVRALTTVCRAVGLARPACRRATLFYVTEAVA